MAENKKKRCNMCTQQLPIKLSTPVVILADGDFPHHAASLEILRRAATIVCCDGAVEKLIRYGRRPDHIVGDMDTLSPALQQEFATILHPSADQETNDLTKAVHFCANCGCEAVHILGATGGREDHSIANIALLTDYTALLRVEMITDNGVFMPVTESTSFKSYPGEKISIFCLTPTTQIITEGLKYPTDKVIFDSWWKGTLNESTGNTFRLNFNAGKVIVYKAF